MNKVVRRINSIKNDHSNFLIDINYWNSPLIFYTINMIKKGNNKIANYIFNINFPKILIW